MGNRSSKDKQRGGASKRTQAAPKQSPLGEWVSPITSAFITEKAVKLTSPTIRESDGALFWLELRPTEAGRQVLVMRSPDGTLRDVTPPPADPPFNVRTTVHEYGGAEYCVVEQAVYFVNFRDQALYVQDLAGGGGPSAPRLVTHGSEARGERFADPVWDVGRRRLVAVSELHRDEATGQELPPGRVVNRLVAIDVSSGSVTPLVTGADFLTSPRVSPCGRWLAWVQWDFPNMPWDRTSLQVAPLRDDGTAGPPTRIAGTPPVSGGGKEKEVEQEGGSAVQQPVWSPDGSYIYFVDDRSGWWNLYRCRTPVTRTAASGTAPTEAAAAAGGGGGAAAESGGAGQGGGGAVTDPWVAAAAEAEALWPMHAEWGFPGWTLGHQSYQVLSDYSLLGLFTDPGVAGMSLGLLQPPPTAAATAGGGSTGFAGGAWQLTRLDTGLTHYSPPRLLVRQQQPAGGGLTLAAVGSSPQRGAAVVQLSVPSAEALKTSRPGDWQVVKQASSQQLPDGYISVPEALEFPTTLDGQATTAFLLYYPPTNKDFTYPPGTLPPLLVESHGGPTSAAVAALSPAIQYWTSRGYAVADIDYGGSTGYGTSYRNRLKGRWGVVDVQDCCAAAKWLAAAGRVDPARLCITGGSAGGFTTLACLAFRKTFSAGAAHYGVADLRLLAEHTHKFESRYLDGLLGPLPQAADVYEARSPLKHVAGMSAPVIFFQGDQDKVVPPEQAIAMHAAVKAAGLPTALVMLAGEEHGFRQATSIRISLDGEFFFYGAVLGFRAEMPEGLPRIELDNPPKRAAEGAAAAEGASPSASGPQPQEEMVVAGK